MNSFSCEQHIDEIMESDPVSREEYHIWLMQREDDFASLSLEEAREIAQDREDRERIANRNSPFIGQRCRD